MNFKFSMQAVLGSAGPVSEPFSILVDNQLNSLVDNQGNFLVWEAM